MTREPVTVGPETTLRDVVDVLSAHGIGGVPVVTDSERLVGVVSAGDVLAFTASTPAVPAEQSDQAEWGDVDDIAADDEDDSPAVAFSSYWEDAGADVVVRMNQLTSAEWDLFEEHTADEVMTRVLHTVAPDTDVVVAAARMAREQIHRLLVVEGDRLIGVVTTMDVVRAIADRRVRA
jgi:CBS domain-containing protein